VNSDIILPIKILQNNLRYKLSRKPEKIDEEIVNYKTNVDYMLKEDPNDPD
jgi:hypothetical protein